MKEAMKYVHPDVVVGEPIPEIEPRVDSACLDAARDVMVLNKWCAVGVLVLLAIKLVLDPGLWVSVAVGLLVFAFLLTKKWKNKKVLDRLLEDRWCIPVRENFHYHSSGLMMLMGFYVLISVPDDIGFLVITFGIWLIVCGAYALVFCRRVCQPGQISCKECSYSLVGLTLPCSCPECGQGMYDGLWTTDRPRVRLPGLVWGGWVGMILGVWLTVTSLARPGMLYGMLPSSALKTMAVTDGKAFEQITQFPMTPEETEVLIESLIAESQNGRLGYQQSDWLGAMMETGGLSADQIEAVMAVLPPVKIRAPSVGRVGEKIELSLETKKVRLASTRFIPYYHFRGFRIGDDSELYEGSDHLRVWRYLYEDLFRSDFVSESWQNRPFYEFTPEESGVVVVRARVVIALTGVMNQRTFEWGEDGEGAFEKEPMWMRVVDLEHTILVTE